MGLFGKKASTTDADVAHDVTEKTSVKKTEKKAPAKTSRFSHVLLAPVVTEKAYMLSEKGQYVFSVRTDATAAHVARAVKDIYGVSVVDVRMIVAKPTKRVFRGVSGMTQKKKKAIVTVAKGATIDLFA